MRYSTEELQLMRLGYYRRERVACPHCGGEVSVVVSGSADGGRGTPVTFRCKPCRTEGTADAPRESGRYTDEESREVVSGFLRRGEARCPHDDAYLVAVEVSRSGRMRRASGRCPACGAHAYGEQAETDAGAERPGSPAAVDGG